MTRLTIFDFIAIGCAIILAWLCAGFMQFVFNGNKVATLLPYAVCMGWVYKYTYDRTEKVEAWEMFLVNLVYLVGFVIMVADAFAWI